MSRSAATGDSEVQLAGAGLTDAEAGPGRWAWAVGVSGGPASGAGIGQSFEGACTHELDQPLLSGSFASVDEASAL